MDRWMCKIYIPCMKCDIKHSTMRPDGCWLFFFLIPQSKFQLKKILSIGAVRWRRCFPVEPFCVAQIHSGGWWPWLKTVQSFFNSKMRLEYVKLCRQSTSASSHTLACEWLTEAAVHTIHIFIYRYIYIDCNERCEMHQKGLCAT